MVGITAILPAYNEEVSIGSVVLRAREYADRVIVIDDGSLGRTAEVAELAGAEVIRHPQSLGEGAAMNGPSIQMSSDFGNQFAGGRI